MKRCKYCGRENDDEAVHCCECGTPFPEALPVAPSWAAKKWKEVLSKLIFGLSCLAALLTLAVFFGSYNWKPHSSDDFSFIIFPLAAFWLMCGSLVLGVIPSAIFFYRKRQPRDWKNLLISGITFLANFGFLAWFFISLSLTPEA